MFVFGIVKRLAGTVLIEICAVYFVQTASALLPANILI